MRHRRTLDVPSRTARQLMSVDCEVPRRLAFLTPLPEHEVAHRFTIVFISIDANTLTEVLRIDCEEPTVCMLGRVCCNVEVHRAITDVAVARNKNVANQILHLRDVVGCEWICNALNINTEGAKVREKLSCEERCKASQILERICGLFAHFRAPSWRSNGTIADRLIIDVCDIHHPAHRIAPYHAECSLQDIGEEECTHVPDMRHIIHGGSA